MHSRQNGAVLFICLIILALLMILGTASIATGVVGLRMASNTSQSVDALQKADAGVNAVMSLVGSGANDPFQSGESQADPFLNFTSSNHPLANINDLTVSTTLVASDQDCDRVESGSSSKLVKCEYFTVTSSYSPVDMGATVIATQGIRREIIAN